MGLRSLHIQGHNWRYVKLPAGKILIPGVVSHATDLVEHPELVAAVVVREHFHVEGSSVSS